MTKTIFLSTISLKVVPTVPYPVGCIISHCLKNNTIKENYTFLEPEYRHDCLQHDDFHQKLKKTDILGLTCYVWNQVINDKISSLFKTINPNGIVIYGGPNVPEDKKLAKIYSEDRKFVDLFFVGPGETNFADFLVNYYKTNSLSNHNGTFTQNENNVNLSRESYKLNYLPTPYLDGLFDKILEKHSNLSIPIETNRGCPYKCVFCDWGGLTQSKITQFDFNTIKSNIDKTIGYDSVNRFNIIDANFGSFPRDVELVDYIYNKKIEHNKTLELVIMGMAKNGSKYVKEVYSRVHKFDVDLSEDDSKTSLKNMKISFQTFSTEALNVIDRTNMTTEKLLDVVDRSNYKTVSSELIIGLPGETPQSWLTTLSQHVPLNLKFARIYHLYVLPNTPMTKEEYIKKYDIKFTKLYIPTDLINKDFQELSDYKNSHNIKTKLNLNDHKLDFETFDIMSSCYSYTNEELKEMYRYYFWFNTFWNTNLLTEDIKTHDLALEEQVKLFYSLINENKMPFMKKIVDQYNTILDSVFSTKNVLIIDNLKNASFFSKNMGRGSELFYIVDQYEEFREEIKLIYPKFNTVLNPKFHLSQYRPHLATQFISLL